jgi:hypothetical protein
MNIRQDGFVRERWNVGLQIVSILICSVSSSLMFFFRCIHCCLPVFAFPAPRFDERGRVSCWIRVSRSEFDLYTRRFPQGLVRAFAIFCILGLLNV